MKTPEERAQKRREDRLRKRCKTYELTMRRSRSRISLDNFGDFMLTDTNRGYVVAGSRFDMTLDDIQLYLNQIN